MARLLDTLGGIWELMRIAVRSRFRLRSSYWRWRAETAFGADLAQRPPFRERMRALLDYARWVHRMKKDL